MKIKKLSHKLALIICTTVVVIAGTIGGIFQARMVMRIDQYSQEKIKVYMHEELAEVNLQFRDSVYNVASIRNYAEVNFDADAYRNNPVEYIDNEIRPVMTEFISKIVSGSEFISGAYFAIDPDFAGFPNVCEVYVEEDDDGNPVVGEVQTYEEYMDKEHPDMEWFYGAFESGKNYWTNIYPWDGSPMVSYVEPIFINGEKVGVAGVDILLESIVDLVKGFQIYDTGVALIKDYEGFLETGDFIENLSDSDKQSISESYKGSRDDGVAIHNIELSNTDYIIAHDTLINDYDIYIAVPVSEYKAENKESILRFAMLFPLVLVLVVIVSIAIGKSVSKPIEVVSISLKNLANGDYGKELPKNIMEIPHEVGRLARAYENLRLRLVYLGKAINTIAEHDLTEMVQSDFEGDIAASSLNDTITTLNDIFSRLNTTANELTSESVNLSMGSGSLSDGCSEQSKTMGELMGIVNNIVETTKENVDMLAEALQIEDKVKKDVIAGDDNMRHLSQTVREINEASQGIHKILKAIEDIAFQTNILALNAAVEAARAGEHGKGFAVVAEEVRNLAAKSATAAKETAQLVETSTQKAQAGESLTAVTSESLAKIIEGIIQTEHIIEKIEQNSHKNDKNITVMSNDFSLVTDITNRVAATAEETAAMSEELSGQAEVLRQMTTIFKLKRGN